MQWRHFNTMIYINNDFYTHINMTAIFNYFKWNEKRIKCIPRSKQLNAAAAINRIYFQAEAIANNLHWSPFLVAILVCSLQILDVDNVQLSTSKLHTSMQNRSAIVVITWWIPINIFFDYILISHFKNKLYAFSWHIISRVISILQDITCLNEIKLRIQLTYRTFHWINIDIL